jgi:hypothetical protein
MSRRHLSCLVSLLLALLLMVIASCMDDEAADNPPLAVRRTCLTRDPGDLERAAIAAHLELAGHTTARGATEDIVAVHVHVIRRDTSVAGGNVSDHQVMAQLDVLNAAYAGTGFQFQLASIDRTTNPDWYSMGVRSDAEARAKHELRRGGPRELNLYTAEPTAGILGWSTFPWDRAEDPELDGVVIRATTMPGGGLPPFDEGDTATHEVGHWMGLYHTFQGGCSAPGDGIDDTPAEAEPAFGCPEQQLSCGGQTPDPSWDFMDYSDDACMDRFTPGQVQRMQEVWAAYRQ